MAGGVANGPLSSLMLEQRFASLFEPVSQVMVRKGAVVRFIGVSHETVCRTGRNGLMLLEVNQKKTV